MNHEEVRSWLKRNVDCRQFLEKSKSGLFCCPYCGSGHGNNETGALSYYEETNTWYCFACQKGGDSIDLYMKYAGIEDFREALPLMAEAFSAPKTASSPVDDINPQPSDKTASEANYSAFYRECIKQLNDQRAKEYLEGRGISLETASQYKIGFSGNEIIIPINDTYYIQRSIDPKAEVRYRNSSGSHPSIFNEEVLYTGKAGSVFVVEGAFDALSIIECGFDAVSLNSTANVKTFLANLKNRPTKAKLLITLDNDDQGRKATDDLKRGLSELRLDFEVVDICAGYKDPNEALVKAKTSFAEALRTSSLSEIEKAYAVNLRKEFLKTISGGDLYKPILTGIYSIDRMIGGGFLPGLYVLAAQSGSGKTTLVLQIADNIAKKGTDVVIFSMEMAKENLLARSISRESYISRGASGSGSEFDILRGEIDCAVEADKYFDLVGDHLSIYEGRKTVDKIYSTIQSYVSKTGRAPVVVVDYLQLIDPAGKDTRESVNHSVDVLARIRREFKRPVILISSMSRSSYMKTGSESMYKESGEIEYTADCLLALTYRGINYSKSNSRETNLEYENRMSKQFEEAKAKNPRELTLSVLKNRFSNVSEGVALDYYPRYNYFGTAKR